MFNSNIVLEEYYLLKKYTKLFFLAEKHAEKMEVLF